MPAVAAQIPRATQITIVDPNELVDEDCPDEVDPATGLPLQLRAYMVVRDPRMMVIPHFFSPQECDHLLQLVQGAWIPSMVGQATNVSEEEYSKGNIENALSTTRTSWSCMMRYAQTSVVERLEHRVAAMAGLPLEQLERMNLVRYAPGEMFNEHHDGKFRPTTIFVYLNELLDDDDAGDTFFPVLGLSFRPRKGAAIMWSNIDGDQEDDRMLHAGRPPRKSMKYGVNIFFNVQRMRLMTSVNPDFSPKDCAIVDLADLGKGSSSEPSMVAYRLCLDPKLVAIPGLLNLSEVDQLLELSRTAESAEAVHKRNATTTCFPGTFTLRLFAAAETPLIESIEGRIVAAGGLSLEYLAALRVVRASSDIGYCNRGCGPKSAYVCLAADGEEVFFTRLGMRLMLRPGDCIMWPNVDWSTGQAVEDLRTMRIHLPVKEGCAPLGLDAFFHDNAVRDQQKQRSFFADLDASAA